MIMIRINEIKNALSHVVGWEQAYDPSKAIAEAMTVSESGLTFQGAHPLCTLDNMRAIMPDDYNMRYPVWNSTTIYKKNDKVCDERRKVWIAESGSIGDAPSEQSTVWKPYNMLSDYLETLTRNGIAKSVQEFLRIKQLEKETRSLLERRTFFDGAGRIKATNDNRHKIVGYEIVPIRAMGVTAKIERIGLQFVGGTGTVKMYLFHSSKVEPIKTFEFEITNANGTFKWFDVKDCYLPYIGDTNAGGAWYLCYNQDELPSGMQSINVSKDWSREPCGTCNVGSVEAWRELTKYMQISPYMLQAPTTFAEFPEMWDVEDMIYTNTHNYGINVEISVGCDLTDFIISQRHIFQNVIQLQVASMALRTLALNPDVRVNRNQSNASRMDILYELDGNTQGRKSGLGYELEKAYKALRLETQGLDRICLACNNHGVRYRTV